MARNGKVSTVSETPAAMADAREQFLGLVAAVRPELHRYCARLTGSVIEGEDIVQDTLAKAFYAHEPDGRSCRRFVPGCFASRTTRRSIS